MAPPATPKETRQHRASLSPPVTLPASVPAVHRGPHPDDFKAIPRSTRTPTAQQILAARARYRAAHPEWAPGVDVSTSRVGGRKIQQVATSALAKEGDVWKSTVLQRKVHAGSKKGSDVASSIAPGTRVGVLWIKPENAPPVLWEGLPDPETDPYQAHRRRALARAPLIRAPIVSVGCVSLGALPTGFGVVAGFREVYVYRGSALWKSNIVLDEPAPNLIAAKLQARTFQASEIHLDPPHIAAAVRLRTEIVGKLTPPEAEAPWHQAAKRFSQQLTDLFVARARVLNIPLDGFAAAYGPGARLRDLTHPILPTLSHGIACAILLGLPPADGGHVVAQAAAIELRALWITPRIGEDILARAYRVLGHVNPLWAQTGSIAEWIAMGGLDRVLREQSIHLALSLAGRAGSLDAPMSVPAPVAWPLSRDGD